MNKHAAAARKRAKYFQIPLCAFAYGSNVKQRLEAIISYGVVEAGTKRWTRMTEEERAEFFRNPDQAGKPPPDFKPHDARHCAVVCGAGVTAVNLGSIRRTLAGHDAFTTFHAAFEQRHGRDTLVRLRTDLVFEARDGNGVRADELAVVAAIYSVIGNKQGPVLITQPRIRRRALGYKSCEVLKQEFPKRQDGGQPLSDSRLRTLLDKLHTRKFFACATYGRRLTYYSHRMTGAALRKAIIERKTYRFTASLVRRLDDEAMTNAIRNQRAATKGQSPPAPTAKPLVVPPAFSAEDVL